MNSILGVWKSDPSDVVTQHLYGDITIEFKDDGQAVYTIHEDDRSQIIFLTYTIIGNQLLTNQPSAPRRESTLFMLLGDKLELDYDGVKTRYIRI